jgi:hypothetical protein
MRPRGTSELAQIKHHHPLWTFWRDADGLAAALGSIVLRGASSSDLEARLAAYEHSQCMPGALVREFPDWQIDINPAGVGIWAAYWCSADGRSRRYVVARSSGELLSRLRALGPMGQHHERRPPYLLGVRHDRQGAPPSEPDQSCTQEEPPS